ncbi:hypothetical protein [Rhodobium gokarnense]|uniref:Flagellin-like hook-associated protein FlgL n=1 Tax=Rhodobium gokarnense TaxID=364296 RepID=A0ABT3HD97_9HYPH|nr:hypothetical protein [Rhodobium gokarnense]MCW2308309.1 flagellin-like hook-associated protein FlgL [Rhodobium gokarnense]
MVSSLYDLQTPMVARLTSLRAQYDGLARQLATEKVSDTYGGLGNSRGLDIALRARSSEIEAWQTTVTNVDLRLKLMDTSLSRIAEIGDDVKTAADPNVYTLNTKGQTNAQSIARTSFAEMVGLLNTDAAGRYLFSGKDVDVKPVESVDKILDGTGTLAGFKQVASERLQADLGDDDLGRLDLSSAGTTVTLAEDGDHPFGFKLTGIVSNLSNATITQPTGTPATSSVEFTDVPANGETITIHAELPDGTTTSIELVVSDDPDQKNGFAAGATAADTTANFEAALQDAIEEEAATTLSAASSMQAAADFFDTSNGGTPQRVDGPPFDTATALRDGSTDTVTWYVGDNGTDDARSTASARIDDTLTVEYGSRANEEGFQQVIQSLAVMTISTFDSAVDTDRDRYAAMASRANTKLNEQPGVNRVETIQVELSTTHYSVKKASERHTATSGTLTTLVEGIEAVDLDEVAVKMLTLKTRLEASYQASALLSQMSLGDYI